jgi:hypothetical protein
MGRGGASILSSSPSRTTTGPGARGGASILSSSPSRTTTGPAARGGAPILSSSPSSATTRRSARGGGRAHEPGHAVRLYRCYSVLQFIFYSTEILVVVG